MASGDLVNGGPISEENVQKSDEIKAKANEQFKCSPST